MYHLFTDQRPEQTVIEFDDWLAGVDVDKRKRDSMFSDLG